MEFDRKVPVAQRLKKDQQRISREGSKLIRSPGRRVGRRGRIYQQTSFLGASNSSYMLSALGFTLRRWVSLADWKTDESNKRAVRNLDSAPEDCVKVSYSQNREDRVDWNWRGCWLMSCDSHSICSSLNSMCCPFLLVLLHSSKPGSPLSQPKGDNSCERQRHSGPQQHVSRYCFPLQWEY